MLIQLSVAVGYTGHYLLCAVWPRLSGSVKMKLWQAHRERVALKRIVH